MDWNLKGGSWDLTELDEAALHNIDTVENNCSDNSNNNNNGSSRFGLVNRRSKGEFCVDLKLGHQVVNNSGTTEESSAVGVSKWKLDAAAAAATGGGGGGGGGVSKTTSSASASASASSKRARAMSNGGQTASCLVDGCNSDLSNCRDYHRRHKVCELHSKTPVVTIGGHKQRFCQQCSRFHSLEEFDEGKRSCRKRLDGHNRRRRKPQPVVPLTRPSATFLSNYQPGTQVLPLIPSSGSHHHVYGGSSGAGVVSPGWDGHGRFHKQQELFLGSTCAMLGTPRISSSYSNKQQEEMAYLEGDSKYVLVRSQNAGIEAAANSAGRSLSLIEESPPPPPCALSLLSSPVVQTTLVHPLALTLHDHTLHSVDTTLLVNNNATHHHHHPSMYNNNMPSDASSPHSLPFHWD